MEEDNLLKVNFSLPYPTKRDVSFDGSRLFQDHGLEFTLAFSVSLRHLQKSLTYTYNLSKIEEK